MVRLGIILLMLIVLAMSFSFQTSFPDIPKTWDLQAIKNFHLPPPDTTVTVSYAPEEYYNSLPEHVIYKSYPVYVREFEKPGYLDSLRQLKPEIVFDPAKLQTPEDWIKAGELVFNWPVAYSPADGKTTSLDTSMFKNNNGRFTKDGVYPFSRYVLNGEGKLVTGSLSCASCHTRILESGEVVPGAQGNVFNRHRFAEAVRTGRIPFPFLQDGTQRLTYAPWAPQALPYQPATAEEFAKVVESIPAGVVDRQGAAYLYPLTTPSLIGIKDIKYFDRTGLMKHDGVGDLMRYAAFNQGMDMLTTYNDFMPGGDKHYTEFPTAHKWNHPFNYAAMRYTDAQLYAMAQYIYSLKPPANPNTFPAEVIRKGQAVFTRSGCVTCHTPPLYTNNKLTPVNGFEPPASHFEKYDIFNVSVETDSVSALYARRGTGYYKVPSLRGLWLMDAYFHNGSLTRLEEVFDPQRLRDDYVPSGHKPPHLKTMAVKGHPFGLDLSAADKQALIAFLKTL